MDFSQALRHLKEGNRVYRYSWTTQKYIFLVRGSEFKVDRKPLIDFFDHGTSILYGAHIDVQYGDGSVGMWSVGLVDVLAEDWAVL